MPRGKYSQLSLAEIDRLSKKNHDNLETLSDLLGEIRYRTDFSATKIQVALTERINELERKSQRNAREETSNNKVKDRNKKPDTTDSEIDILRRQLSQARDKIASLEAHLKTNGRSDIETLFRRVGLNKDCPDFVIHAARMAYRKVLHPDTRPEAQKKEAHRKFIDAEEAFKKIFQLRNL